MTLLYGQLGHYSQIPLQSFIRFFFVFLHFPHILRATNVLSCEVSLIRSRHSTNLPLITENERKSIYYDVCPYATKEEELQMMKEIEARAKLVQQKLEELNKMKLHRLKLEYWMSEKSSKSFAFTAILAIVILFLLPFIFDFYNFINNRRKRQKKKEVFI
ncbi:hypothetical protein SNEBB_005309 [Seison nebaliae]|nr:hypothetical protein SNEBB_005309 [Seison nebaliae]